MTTIAQPPKARKPKAKKVVRESLQKRNLRYFFTDPERLELGRRLGEKTNEIAILEDEKARATKDYASRIKTVENEVAGISQRVREGYEFRDIDVKVIYDTPEPGKKTIVRLDTKETVEVTGMTTEEKAASQASLADIDKSFAGDGKVVAFTSPPVDEITAAIEVLKATNRATPAMFQRRMKIGYNAAAKIMEELERRGIVGPENGSAPREILVDLNLIGQPQKPEPKKTKAEKPGVVDVPSDKK